MEEHSFDTMGSVVGEDVVSNDGGGGKERIYVSVRIRPLNEKEIEKNDASDWECVNNNTVIFKDSLPERSIYPSAYTFDRVFGCDNSTKQVYEEGVKEVALSVVSGINSSIFAYGQTSSGKTYTMTGVTQYSMSEIYEYIHKHPEREFSLKFSAIEIYNELVRDLLYPDSGPLRLLDDPEKGTTVEKLTEEILRDEEHLKELLGYCEAQRQIGETSLNEMSSRSHQILRLTVESSAREFVGKNTFSTLMATVNFVDLAGSERASQALTAGSRLKEGCHINRSLLTLGTVIRKLSKGRTGHIPYRDSKLTRILQSTLGGNARTAIICTMSPARCHIEQSRNTLQFAICAKEVATSAQVNVIMSDKALVKHLQKEVARLENEMKYTGLSSEASISDALKEKDAQIKKMENEMKELIKQRDLAQSRLEDLLRTVADDQASGPWEESSQSSMPCAQLSFDDTTLSESSVVSYQSPEYGVSHVHSNSKLCGKVEDQQYTITPLYPSSMAPGFTDQEEEVSPSTSPDIDTHFKEVRCIRMIKPNMINVDEFMPLSNENIHSPVVDNEEPVEVQISNKQKFEVETEVNNELTYGVEAESVNVPLQWNMVNKLSKSRSCRASFMNCGSSLWFEEIEKCKDTSCISVFEDNPELPRRSQKDISLSSGCEKKEYKIDTSDSSEVSELNDVTEHQDNEISYNFEVSILNDVTEHQDNEISYNGKLSHPCDSVDGLKEIAQLQYQQGLSDDQDPKNNINNEDSTVKIMANQINDVCLKPVLKPSESQSEWKLEFEKKQQEIVELWHACNVSLIHRSYFFLLIKGDLADSIYVEVEHRRLSFLKKYRSHGNLNKSIPLENVSLDFSERIVRREREKLCRAMNRMHMSKRETLYKKWGVDLKSKQRRLQVARKVWTETKDMDHVKESAMLMANLFGFLELRLAPKEMFGLSFMPRPSTHASYSWKTPR